MESRNEADLQALYRELFPENAGEPWLMLPPERYTLMGLLQVTRPKHAIEIGTYSGGSLAVMSRYCGRVYTIDVEAPHDPAIHGRFQNVEFIQGTSDEEFPKLLDRLSSARAELGFILMDGDHSFKGVTNDIEALLSYRPLCPLYVLIHDSFSPPCRRAIKEAHWSSSEFLHWVEVDFVPGNLWQVSREGHTQLWNGFSLIILKPEKRQVELRVRASYEPLFNKALPTMTPAQSPTSG